MAATQQAETPHLTGWGRPELSDLQNRLIEADHQESIPVLCSAGAATSRAMIPEIEALIRKRFKFDEGWNMMVAEEMLYGDLLWFRQNIGNCVGASHGMLLAAAIAHEVVAIGQAEERLGLAQLAIPFVPYSYGVGRWVGGMLGPGDGSYCGAQIKGTMKYGFLPCDTPGLAVYAGTNEDALPQGTVSAGRLFGKSQKEIEKWTAQAASFDLLEAPKPQNADESYELIADSQIAQQICSGVMPTFWKVDPVFGALYRMGERAGHSMQLVAAFSFKGQKFIVVRNQWGKNAHKANDVFGIRGDCMVIPLEELARWYKQGVEVVGIGEIQGRPSGLGGT